MTDIAKNKIVSTGKSHENHYITLYQLSYLYWLVHFILGHISQRLKKDREMVIRENEREAQHREEMANKEKESDSWKEKYFQILIDRAKDNNGPK